MFEDAKFMTAEDKELVLDQWKNFIKVFSAGESEEVKRRAFTKRLYDHLYLHCEFIAHYDQNGFFHHFFASAKDGFEFFQRFDQGSWWSEDYKDLCNAMSEHFEKFKPVIYRNLRAGSEQQKEAEIRRLEAELAQLRAEDKEDKGSLNHYTK